MAVVQALRQQELFKAPGIAETLDWASALVALGADRLDAATVSDTLGVVLKYQDDIARLDKPRIEGLLKQAETALKAAE